MYPDIIGDLKTQEVERELRGQKKMCRSGEPGYRQLTSAQII